jgi:uncharacterized protein YidB (DUF937 family)
MSIFNLVGQIANAAAGGASHDQQSVPGVDMAQLTNALGGMLQNTGGVGGLMTAFQQQGAGDLIQSWIGTGQNLPVQAETLVNVLGGDRLKALAEQLGVSPEVATTALTQVLPTVIDKLTPNGSAQEGDQGLSGLGSLIGSFF